MSDVSWPEILIPWLRNDEDAMLDQCLRNDSMQLVQGRAPADSDVVNLARGAGGGGRRLEICLPHVREVAEISAGLAISEQGARLAARHREHPLRNDGR